MWLTRSMLLSLSVRLRSDALHTIFHWARDAGYSSLAQTAFKRLLHSLACDGMLQLHATVYDMGEQQVKNQIPVMEKLRLQPGGPICSGTATEYKACLKEWRDDSRLAYWIPACNDFPSIDSIVKFTTDSRKTQVAYLRFTTSGKRDIDVKQLERLNKIFHGDRYPQDTTKPYYIAVCPDRDSCHALVLKNVVELRKVCEVCVGYYSQALVGHGGATADLRAAFEKALPPPSAPGLSCLSDPNSNLTHREQNENDPKAQAQRKSENPAN